MKKLITITVAVVTLISLNSCKKCSTCTINTYSSKTAADTTLTSEFCGSGNVYKDELSVYEKNNWVCTEN